MTGNFQIDVQTRFMEKLAAGKIDWDKTLGYVGRNLALTGAQASGRAAIRGIKDMLNPNFQGNRAQSMWNAFKRGLSNSGRASFIGGSIGSSKPLIDYGAFGKKLDANSMLERAGSGAATGNAISLPFGLGAELLKNYN